MLLSGYCLSRLCCFRRSMNARRSDSPMRYPRLPMLKATRSPCSIHVRTVLSLTRSCWATSWTVYMFRRTVNIALDAGEITEEQLRYKVGLLIGTLLGGLHDKA